MIHQIVHIGSYALSQHLDIGREPRDSDKIMKWDTYCKYIGLLKQHKTIRACYPTNNGKKQIVKYDDKIVEIEIAWQGSTAEMILNRYKNTIVDQPDREIIINTIADLDLLYELKMSHRYLKNSPHFHKTMNDIKLMEAAGAVIEDKEFFERREKETYNYKHPVLNVDKNMFFKDETYNFYQHDDIHESVKIGEQPAYKMIIEEGQQVKCSLDKWNTLTEQQRLHCALEECYVLSLERGLIPNEFKTDPKKTFDIALVKVCTSITSGWFREWCWRNYDLIKENYNEDYCIKFKNALELNLIRKFKEDD